MKRNFTGILSGIIIAASIFASSCTSYSLEEMDHSAEIFSAFEIKSIDCSLISESIEIEETDINRIEVDMYTSPYYKCNLYARNENGTLRIYASNSGKHQPFSSRQEKGEIHVRIPKKCSFENCNIIICTGRMAIKDIKAKTLSINSDAGSIEISRTVSDACIIKNESGSVKIIDAAGKLSASTTAGSINVKYSSPLANDVDLNAAAGSIKISLNKNSSFEATCVTSLGNVYSSNFQKNGTKISNGSKLYKISLKTTVGSITVE